MARTNISKSARAIDRDEFFVFQEPPTGALDSSNKSFTLAYDPNLDASFEVFINGQIAPSGSAEINSIAIKKIVNFNKHCVNIGYGPGPQPAF